MTDQTPGLAGFGSDPLANDPPEGYVAGIGGEHDRIVDPSEPIAEPPDSLSARMRESRQALEEQTSERFPIPGYPYLYVELSILPWETTTKIRKRLEKLQRSNPGLFETYFMRESIIAGTVAFWSTDREALVPEGETWVSLAKRVNPRLGDDVSPRVAIGDLIPTGIELLMNDWQTWQQTERGRVQDEVVEDFATTR
jgi:hypothetical protein